MIYNYPYFGFPNYMNYISKNTPPKASNCSNPNYNFQNYTPFKSNVRANYPYTPSPVPKVQNANNNARKQQFSFPSYNEHKSGGSIIKNDSSKQKNEEYYPPFLNLFGIQLHFDDILLICIILFLYNEKIEDNYLLLALVLLLLG